jgi:hypothetical protein
MPVSVNEDDDKDRLALIKLNVAVRLAVEALDALPHTADDTLRDDLHTLIGRIDEEAKRLAA